MDIVSCLENCVTMDEEKLKNIQEQFDVIVNMNFCGFMRQLSEIIINTACSSVVRSAACLIMKNQLTSKNPIKLSAYQLRWHQLSQENREYIKFNLLCSLGTEQTRPSIVAQCIAYIAIAELPIGRWNNLITIFLITLNDALSSNLKKESTLYALGYICQELNSSFLDSYSQQILMVIVRCLSMEQECFNVRIAAARALYNSLELNKQNFEMAAERNFIMSSVCDGIQSENSLLAIASLECLVKIVSLYYTYIESYLPGPLLSNVMSAMKSNHAHVALQGIEFWSNIADEEMNLKLSQISNEEMNLPPSHITKHYALGALKYILPILLEQLVRHADYNFDDNWDPMTASRICIVNLSECCKDAVIEYFIPIYEHYIQSECWQFRNAGIMALGSILSGLEKNTLRTLLRQALPVLIPLLRDENACVRDTTTWTFGKIGYLAADAIIKSCYFAQAMESFIDCLKMEPRIAANICWAIVGISNECYRFTRQYMNKPSSSCWLSPFYSDIMSLLFWNTTRNDCSIGNLQANAYEAILVMIKNAPMDCYRLRLHSMFKLFQNINVVYELYTHLWCYNDRTEFNDLQSLVCNTLQIVMLEIKPDDLPSISDVSINAILELLNNNGNKVSIVIYAFETIEVIVKVLNESFFKYIDILKPYLLNGLSCFDKPKIFSKTIVLLGVICKSLKKLLIPYMDECMFTLLTNLNNINFDSYNCRPEIIESFGYIATGTGKHFQNYWPAVFDVIMSSIRIPIDFKAESNSIHISCLKSLSDILTALRTSSVSPEPNLRIMEPKITELISFIHQIANNNNSSRPLIGYASQLVGKLCTAFGSSVYSILINKSVSKMLTKARLTKHSNVSYLANCAIAEIIQSQDENASSKQALPSHLEPKFNSN